MIRNASRSDFAAITALESQIYAIHLHAHPDLIKPQFDEGLFHEYLEECLDDDNGSIFVFEENGEILGYCITRKRKYRNHRLFFDMLSLELDDICVDEKARGRQIGTQLFEAAKAYAAEIGASHLELTVWEFNKNARRFFERQEMTPRLTRMELDI